jgi:hypothetical protein
MFTLVINCLLKQNLKLFNVKGKVVALYAMKAKKGNRGIAPFILDFGTRWW